MSNDTTKPNPSFIFPNGCYYWKNGIQIDPLSPEGQTIIHILNQQKADRAKQTPTPQVSAVPPLRQQVCFIFDIHCEDGNSKIGVVLSASDFELLKRDVHIMAVININQILSMPNTKYDPDLKTWIIMHSITKVPSL